MTTIRALAPTDDRSLFESGDIELDRFFRQFAGQNQFKHFIGTTYVAVDDVSGKVLGYATVAPAQVEIEGLPSKARKGLPAYPLPVLRLARLAVGVRTQRQGIGPALLRYVLGLSLQLAQAYGCIGVVVDAYQTAKSFYGHYGFVELDVLEGGSQTRPTTSAMFLSVKEIRAAKG